MAPRLTDHEVLTFDCYGTLIDWESGIWDAQQPLFAANGGDLPGRSEALQAHARHEHVVESESPAMLYSDILVEVHRRLAAEFGLETSDALDTAFGASLSHWPAFADTAEALRYLKTRFKLVILSNVSRAGIAASNRKLGVEFDAIYTAEDIGSYKPATANFDYLLSHLQSDFDIDKTGILHTAQSLFHDHAPANQFGLANAWIDRQRLSEDGDWGATARVDPVPTFDFKFFSMGEMARAVQVEE